MVQSYFNHKSEKSAPCKGVRQDSINRVVGYSPLFTHSLNRMEHFYKVMVTSAKSPRTHMDPSIAFQKWWIAIFLVPANCVHLARFGWHFSFCIAFYLVWVSFQVLLFSPVTLISLQDSVVMQGFKGGSTGDKYPGASLFQILLHIIYILFQWQSCLQKKKSLKRKAESSKTALHSYHGLRIGFCSCLCINKA